MQQRAVFTAFPSTSLYNLMNNDLFKEENLVIYKIYIHFYSHLITKSVGINKPDVICHAIFITI